MEKEYIIKEDGIRLDKAIAELDSDISRMTVQKLIEDDKILVNGKK